MPGVRWYHLGLMLMLFGRPTSAIQLLWSSGASDLTFDAARRCTLVVQSDPQEGRLPPLWDLVWVASDGSIDPVPINPLTACTSVVANVSAAVPPATPADSAEHASTAVFCSVPPAAASTALYLLDLAAGVSGKLKVVAIDPSDPDSSRVMQSPEVTFNGGVPDPFPPAILRVTTVHHSTEFRLDAVGAGLARTRALKLLAPDGSWELLLSIAGKTDSTIMASASIAANVPACVIEAVGENDAVAMASVSADPPPPPITLSDPPEGCESKMREIWPNHDPYLIQPKDFAFVTGGWTPTGTWTFHLFYIRRNQSLNDIDTEKNLGHAVSDTLSGWTVIDTAAIKTRTGRWDALHVWAPSIVQRGLTYYMFYAGVDGNGDQRIGLATSTDLFNWTQGDSILEVNNTQIPWANPTPAGYGFDAQLRDAFVMKDPNVPGDWLMYFVTATMQYAPKGMVVGVARSHGNFQSWEQTFPLWNTRFPFGEERVESPHAFLRDNKWWLFYTVNGDTVWTESNAYTPADTVDGGARWTQEQKLWTLVPPLQSANLYFWHATEYLNLSTAFNDIEYLAAWNDANVCISITQMRPAISPYLFTMGCPSALDVGGAAVAVRSPRLLLTGMRPAHSQVGLRIELPTRMRAHLAVYDVMGRRVKTITDGELPAGGTELSWDGQGEGGSLVGSGLYFASLTAAGVRLSVRVPLIR